MITIEQTDFRHAVEAAHRHGMVLPIEQTKEWADYQATVDGRSPWGVFIINRNGEFAAVVSFIEYRTHGYRYLRSLHGPAWSVRPDPATERETIDALSDAVRSLDHGIVFLRINTWHDAGTRPVLSTVPYDSTVIVDLTGGDEAILQRMKSRGRANVRKALRESPATCADETEQATRSFDEYYGVMVDTAARDGFTPAPMSDYAEMLRVLGPEHCRLFAGRIDGKVVNWCLVTINDNHAVYYYGCMSSAVRRMRVPDKLFYHIFCTLGARGIDSLDMMGIGSDFSPSLMSLNQFKTKFANDITRVAPDRDVPVRRTFYALLTLMKRTRTRLRRTKSSR